MTLIIGGLLYFTNINNSKAYYYGPPGGYTGSPGDGGSTWTCDHSGCHNSNPLQAPKPWISSNIPAAGYKPDSIYTLTAKAVYIGKTAFGFEISPQNPSSMPVGTLIITNATATQLTTYSSFQYVEQTQNSYLGTDSLSWTFNWKAPAAGAGPVTFYGCFNCGQGNSSPNNTYVYPATLTLPENTSAGLNTITNERISFSVFPNPANEEINISFSLKNPASLEINFYGLDGSKISNLLHTEINAGEHIQSFAIPSEIKSGIYLIQLIANGQSTAQRIIVNR